jgi:hypothetical protein
VADGRSGDGDDRAVEEIHDLGDEHDRQDDPAPAVGGRGRFLRGDLAVEVEGSGDGGGHLRELRWVEERNRDDEHCS